MHGLRDHQNSADLGPTAWPSPPKRTPRDPRAPTHTQKLAPALLPSLSWATLTWNPPLGQLAWPETSRPLVLKSSDCPCLTSTPETYPQAGLASPSAVQGEQQQRRWGKGDRHIAPRGRGACTGHTGQGPAPVPRPPTVAGAGGRASRAARGHAILSVGSWRPSWQEIPVAAREESAVLCFPSRRGLTPRGSLVFLRGSHGFGQLGRRTLCHPGPSHSPPSLSGP